MSSPTTTTPPDLAPHARALAARVLQQLNTPTAHFAPPGVRSCIGQLAGLVVDLAERVDQLTHQPAGAPPHA